VSIEIKIQNKPFKRKLELVKLEVLHANELVAMLISIEPQILSKRHLSCLAVNENFSTP